MRRSDKLLLVHLELVFKPELCRRLLAEQHAGEKYFEIIHNRAVFRVYVEGQGYRIMRGIYLEA